MPQCESKVFFPDGSTQPPQFNDCPRRAETTRRLSGFKVVKLCTRCAKVWDETDFLSVGTFRGEKNNEVRGEKKLSNERDRKSTRLNSSHLGISYAVFCL